MKTSIITAQKAKYVLAGVAWLCIWQIVSMIIGEELFFVSPFKVVQTLVSLALTSQFWLSVGYTFMRIGFGFVIGVVLGIVFAAIANAFSVVEIMLAPFMLTVRCVPVASFIILALLWLKNAGNLAILISFLMVLPIIYSNTLSGLKATDNGLKKMAQVFKLSLLKRITYIYIPQTMPHFLSGCTLALGLCWKSGIAAEVIGITNNSIGGALYTAKLIFATNEVFAWTLTIVIISLAFEKLVLLIIKKLYHRWLK